MKELERNGQVIFRYCDSEGNITEVSNPNGSMNSIAGVCNLNKNVFGLMPHPERASDPFLQNTDGSEILKAFIHSVN